MLRLSLFKKIFLYNNRRGSDHVVHITIPSPWEMDSEPQVRNKAKYHLCNLYYLKKIKLIFQSYFVKAVIGLLQEAVPYGSGIALECQSS